MKERRITKAKEAKLKGGKCDNDMQVLEWLM